MPRLIYNAGEPSREFGNKQDTLFKLQELHTPEVGVGVAMLFAAISQPFFEVADGSGFI